VLDICRGETATPIDWPVCVNGSFFLQNYFIDFFSRIYYFI